MLGVPRLRCQWKLNSWQLQHLDRGLPFVWRLRCLDAPGKNRMRKKWHVCCNYSKKSIAPYIFIDEDELCIFSSLGLESPPSRKFELDIFFGHHKAGFWTAQGPKPKGHLWALQRRWDFGHQGLQPHLARLEHPGRTISFMARTPTLSEFKQGLTTRRSTKNMVCMWLSMIGMKGLQTLVVYGYINFSFVDSLYICIFWFFNYEDRDLWVERRQWLETLGNTCERVTCEDL